MLYNHIYPFTGSISTQQAPKKAANNRRSIFGEILSKDRIRKAKIQSYSDCFFADLP